MVELHLENAARTLQRILNARDPDHVYTVSVLPPDRLWPQTGLYFIRWLCDALKRKESDG